MQMVRSNSSAAETVVIPTSHHANDAVSLGEKKKEA